MTLRSDLQKTAPGKKVVLFELDMTPLGGTILRFTPMSLRGGSPITYGPVNYDGNTYTPWPIEIDDIELDGSGQLARPKLRVANINNGFTPTLVEFNDLKGAKLKRIRTLSHYLDDGSSPDVNEIYRPDIFKVSKKLTHNLARIEWEMRAGIDLEGTTIPKVKFIRPCQARYRHFNPATGTLELDTSRMACPFADEGPGKYFTVTDTPTDDPAQDNCSHTIPGCEKRYGVNQPLPYRGFPNAARVR